MDRRSTNVKGFVHYGGDVASGAADGIGVRLGSASTGSTAWVESVSDDTNANIGIRAQGAGTVSIGNSSNAVNLGGTKFAAYSTTFAWTLAALSSGQTLEVTLTTSVGDLNPAAGDVMTLSLGDISGYVGMAIMGYRFSTTATSRVTVLVGNISSTATSTASGTGRVSWIDLT
jgi:hypothetical protein